MIQLERRFLEKMINSARGTFGVTFIKKGNNEVRTMRCGKKTTKYLRGGQATYSAGEKNLLRVVDVNIVRAARKANTPNHEVHAIRAIPLENITELRVNGRVYTIIGSFSEVNSKAHQENINSRDLEEKLA